MFSKCWRDSTWQKQYQSPLLWHGRSNTSHHFFGRSLQIILQACPQSPVEEEEMSRVSYASAVGSSMYAMVCIRPDLAYTVNTVSQFMSNPVKQHWKAVKWVLRYLRETARLGFVFQRLETGKPRLLQRYVDAHYTRDLDQ